MQERQGLHTETINGALLRTMPHRLSSTELCQEEFRENICLRYDLMPQDIHVTCSGCSKKLSIYNALTCPNGGLVMGLHDDDSKEWFALGSQALTPSPISYEPHINSRTLQGGSTGEGSQREGETADGGISIDRRF